MKQEGFCYEFGGTIASAASTIETQRSSLFGHWPNNNSASNINNNSMDQRLKQLYPFVDESKTPLPRFWSTKDKYQLLSLTHDDLRVHYKGQGKSHKDAAAVRANHLIPASCGLYYFEIRIINKGRDGLFGIGLSQAGVSLNRLPGWDKFSYGYHGDDGHSFSFSGSGLPYGPTFSSGDVIGCGLNLIDNCCFYTKNGYNIGIAFTDLPPDLYPTVGLQTPGEVVEANFGQHPFVYDVYEEIKIAQIKIRNTIQAFHLPPNKTEYFNKLVSSYLVHHGYSATAESFNRLTNQTAQEDCESIKNREKIMKLILNGRIGEAIYLVQQIYPGLLERNKNLLFMLKCRQFVEMVAGCDDIRHVTPSSSCSVSPHGSNVSTSQKSSKHYQASTTSGSIGYQTGINQSSRKHTPSPKDSPRNSPRSMTSSSSCKHQPQQQHSITPTAATSASATTISRQKSSSPLVTFSAASPPTSASASASASSAAGGFLTAANNNKNSSSSISNTTTSLLSSSSATKFSSCSSPTQSSANIIANTTQTQQLSQEPVSFSNGCENSSSLPTQFVTEDDCPMVSANQESACDDGCIIMHHHDHQEHDEPSTTSAYHENVMNLSAENNINTNDDNLLNMQISTSTNNLSVNNNNENNMLISRETTMMTSSSTSMSHNDDVTNGCSHKTSNQQGDGGDHEGVMVESIDNKDKDNNRSNKGTDDSSDDIIDSQQQPDKSNNDSRRNLHIIHNSADCPVEDEEEGEIIEDGLLIDMVDNQQQQEQQEQNLHIMDNDDDDIDANLTLNNNKNHSHVINNDNIAAAAANHNNYSAPGPNNVTSSSSNDDKNFCRDSADNVINSMNDNDTNNNNNNANTAIMMMMMVEEDGCIKNGHVMDDDDVIMDTSDCDDPQIIQQNQQHSTAAAAVAANNGSSPVIISTDTNIALVHFGRELHQLSIEILKQHQIQQQQQPQHSQQQQGENFTVPGNPGQQQHQGSPQLHNIPPHFLQLHQQRYSISSASSPNNPPAANLHNTPQQQQQNNSSNNNNNSASGPNNAKISTANGETGSLISINAATVTTAANYANFLTKELKMMQDAFSLMAYSDPWKSPVSHQLQAAQREPVASALNSLILETHGYPPNAPLEAIMAHAQRLREEMAKIGLGSAAFADPMYYTLP